MTEVCLKLYTACLQARAQLGDLVREGKATDDDREAYEALNEAIAAADAVPKAA